MQGFADPLKYPKIFQDLCRNVGKDIGFFEKPPGMWGGGVDVRPSKSPTVDAIQIFGDWFGIPEFLEKKVDIVFLVSHFIKSLGCVFFVFFFTDCTHGIHHHQINHHFGETLFGTCSRHRGHADPRKQCFFLPGISSTWSHEVPKIDFLCCQEEPSCLYLLWLYGEEAKWGFNLSEMCLGYGKLDDGLQSHTIHV